MDIVIKEELDLGVYDDYGVNSQNRDAAQLNPSANDANVNTRSALQEQPGSSSSSVRSYSWLPAIPNEEEEEDGGGWFDASTDEDEDEEYAVGDVVFNVRNILKGKIPRWLNPQVVLENIEDMYERYAGGQYICKICLKTVKHIGAIKVHMRTHSGTKYIFNTCTDCGVSFTLLRNYRSHIKSHSTKGSFVCLICEKDFSRAIYLKRHLSMHDKVRCDSCKEVFLNSMALNEHLKCHINQKLMPILPKKPIPDSLPPQVIFECQQCSASFVSKSLLAQHVAQHTTCKNCQMQFATREALIKHFEIFACGKPCCELCGDGFNNDDLLMIHMENHRLDEVSSEVVVDENKHSNVTDNAFKYPCPFCKRKFKFRSGLIGHLQIHKKERDNNIKIMREIKRLQTVPMLDCKICKISFPFESLLRRHLLWHDKNGPVPKLENRINSTSSPKNVAVSQPSKEAQAKLLSGGGLLVGQRRTLSCRFCRETFSRLSLKKAHSKIHMKCARCGLQFDSPESFSRHSKKHRGYRPYNCMICSRDFKHHDSLFKHLNIHDKRNEIVLPRTDEAGSDKAVGSQDAMIIFADELVPIVSEETVVPKEENNENTAPRDYANEIDRYEDFSVLKEETVPANVPDLDDKECQNFTSSDTVATDEPKNKFSCRCCSMSFDSVALSKEHHRTHLTCGYCGLVCQSIEKLRKHSRKHPHYRPFACKFCPKTYRDLFTLQGHELLHQRVKEETQKRHVCKHCGRGYNNLASLNRHISVIHAVSKSWQSLQINQPLETSVQADTEENPEGSQKNKQYVCHICNISFSHSSALHSHLRLHKKVIPNPNYPHHCTVCGRGFNKQAAVTRHLRFHRFENTGRSDVNQANLKSPVANYLPSLRIRKPFSCKSCFKRFVSSSLLNSHVRTHFKCPTCEKQCSGETELNRHVKIHENTEEWSTTKEVNAEESSPLLRIRKQFGCRICSKSFVLSSLLGVHMAEHLKCPKCDEHCSSVADLKSHFKIHSGNVSWICQFCEKVSENQPELIEHIREIHRITNPAPFIPVLPEAEPFDPFHKMEENPFVCRICNDGFASENMLTIHFKIHCKKESNVSHSESEKPESVGPKTFNCNKCGYTFIDKNTYIIHIDTHMFRCNVCDGLFPSASLLKEHKKTHFEDNTATRSSTANAFGESLVRVQNRPQFGATKASKAPFKCKYCLERFDMKSKWEEHVLKHREEHLRFGFKCLWCKKEFNKAIGLSNHVRGCNNQKQYDLSENSSGDATVHRNSDLTNESNQTRGQDCLIGISKDVPDKIVNKKPSGAPKCKMDYVCLYCGKRFKCESNLKIHELMFQHSSFPSISNKISSYISEMNAETDTNANNDEDDTADKRNESSLCAETISDQSERLQHIVVDHSSDIFKDKKPVKRCFTCKICKQVFQTKQSRNVHWRHCLRPRWSFVCQLCGLRCMNENRLKSHILTHNPVERPFACNKCERRFKSHGMFSRHIKMHNGISTKHFKTKALRQLLSYSYCTTCEKVFMLESDLEAHFVTHSNAHNQSPPDMNVQHAENPNKNNIGYEILENLLESVFKTETENGEVNNDKLRPPDLDQCMETSIQCELDLVKSIDGTEETCKNLYNFGDKQNARRRPAFGNFQCSKCPLRFMSKERIRAHGKAHRLGRYQLTKTTAAMRRSLNSGVSNGSSKLKKEALKQLPLADNEKIIESVYGLSRPTDKSLVTERSLFQDYNFKSTPVQSRTEDTLTTISESILSVEKSDIGKDFFDMIFESVCRTSDNKISSTNENSCRLCFKLFKNIKGLNRHCRVSHGTESNLCSIVPYYCKVCGNPCATESFYVDHVKQHYFEGKCSECPMRFVTKNALICHLRTHKLIRVQKRNPIPYKCKQCPCGFDYEHLLQKHLLGHKERPQSDLNSERQSDLKSIKNELDSSIITKEFNNTSSLCNNDEEFPYNCIHCSKRFKSETNLKYHSAKHNNASIDVQQIKSQNPGTSGLKTDLLVKVKSDLVNDSFFKSKKLPKRFQCRICKDRFTRKSRLARHMTLHENASFTCPYCREILKNLQLFNEHVKEHGIENVVDSQGISCPWCKKGFKYEKKLSVHLLKHTGDASFKNTSENVVFKQGVKQFTPVGPTFRCRYCKDPFDNENALASHIEKAHKRVKGALFRCSLCRKVFSWNNNLVRHKREAHGIFFLKECPYCKEVFKSKKKFNTHLISFHKKEENLVESKKANDEVLPLNCKYCGKTFMFEQNLKIHLLSHRFNADIPSKAAEPSVVENNIGTMSIEQKAVLQVPSTSAPLTNRKAVKRPLSSGLDKTLNLAKKSYIATIAPSHPRSVLKKPSQNLYSPNEIIKNPDTIAQSQSTTVVKQESVESGFNCPYCYKHFMFEANLKIHLLVHKTAGGNTANATTAKEFVASQYHAKNSHSVAKKSTATASIDYDSSGDANSDPLLCKFCNKQFASKFKLTLHLRVHTGERPIVCWYCPKTFTQTASRNLHASRLHKETRRCPICKKVFENQKVYNEHMTIIHSQEQITIVKAQQNDNDEQLPFNCQYCDKGFRYEKRFEAHLLTHTPFPCSFCSKVCDSKTNLKWHVESFHKGKLTDSHILMPGDKIKLEPEENIIIDEIPNEVMDGSVYYTSNSFSGSGVTNRLTNDNSPKYIEISDDEYLGEYHENSGSSAVSHRDLRRGFAKKNKRVKAAGSVASKSRQEDSSAGSILRRKLIGDFSDAGPSSASPSQAETVTESNEWCDETTDEDDAPETEKEVSSTSGEVFNVLHDKIPNKYNPRVVLDSISDMYKAKGDKYQCKVCSKVLSDIQCMQGHMRTHTGEQPYSCEFCSRQFTHRSQLHNHLPIHDDEGSEICYICDKSFVKLFHLNNHVKMHDNVKCGICKKVFNDSLLLNSHLKSHKDVKSKQKPTKNDKLQCKECSRSFGTAALLKQHLKKHTSCKDCGMEFVSRKALTTHTRTISCGKQCCELCGRGFGHDESLMDHMKTHSPSDLESGESSADEYNDSLTHSCSRCGDEFQNQSSLNVHLRSCQRGKKTVPAVAANTSRLERFPCSFCEGKFEYKSQLLRHLVKHNAEEGEDVVNNEIEQIKSFGTPDQKGNFNCKTCGVGFYHRFALKKHVEIVHGEIRQTSDGDISVDDEQASPAKSNVKRRKLATDDEAMDSEPNLIDEEVDDLNGDEDYSPVSKKKKRPKLETSGRGSSIVKNPKASGSNNVSQDTKKTNYECKICGMGFYHNYKFLAHSQMHLEEERDDEALEDVSYIEENNLPCQYCNKFFPNSAKLGRHMKLHNKYDNLPDYAQSSSSKAVRTKEMFPCRFCSKKFASKSLKEAHSKIHYKCGKCDEQFGSYKALYDHARIHPEYKAFICVICSADFFSYHALFQHLDNHDKIEESTKSFVCKTCGEDCEDIDELQNHERIHKLESREVSPTEEENVLDNYSDAEETNEVDNFSEDDDIVSYEPPTNNSGAIPEDNAEANETATEDKSKKKCCSLCELTFDTGALLKDHMRVHATCGFCGLVCRSVQMLRKHSRKHPDYRPFKCKHCPKGFRDPEVLNKHALLHKKVQVSGKRYTCKHCGRGYDILASLNRHISMIHGGTDHLLSSQGKMKNNADQDTSLQGIDEDGTDKRNTCKVCGKDFPKNSYLLRHLQLHRKVVPNPNDPFQCQTCGRGFSKQRALTRHLLFHANENFENPEGDKAPVKANVPKYVPPLRIKKPFGCKNCSKSFFSSSLLSMHIRSHFTCSKCNKQCNGKIDLENHLKTHVKKPSWICQFCEKPLESQPDLIKHIRQIHRIPNPMAFIKAQPGAEPMDVEETEEKPFVCLTCNECFTSERSLKIHFKVHDEKPTKLENPVAARIRSTPRKSFECKQCGKACSNKKTYLDHIETHSADFGCNECEELFASESLLNSHMKTHSNGKPFVCHCGERFMTLSTLSVHKLQHSLVEDDSEDEEEKEEADAEVDVKPFVCHQCNICFRLESYYKDHMKFHESMQKAMASKVLNKRKSSENNKAGKEAQQKDGKFDCIYCLAQFEVKSKFYEHIQKHREDHLKFGYKCSLCKKDHRTDLSLSKHMKVHSGERRQVTTESDEDSVGTSENLSNHATVREISDANDSVDVPSLGESINENSNDDSSKDAMLQKTADVKTFTSDNTTAVIKTAEISKLTPNENTDLQITSETPKPYVCSDCGLRFKCESNLKIHQITFSHGSKVEDTVETDQNSSAIFISAELVQSTSGGDESMDVSCAADEDQIESAELVKTEGINNIFSKTNKRLFNCHLCDSGFLYKRNLNQHLMAHNSVDKGFKTEDASSTTCKVCFQVYISHQALLDHMRGHTSKLCFRCSFCGERFISKLARREHVLEAHKSLDIKPKDVLQMANSNGSPEPLLACPLCNQCHQSEMKLKNHIKTHIDDEVPPPHICQECKRSFKSQQELVRHFLIDNSCLKVFDSDRKFLNPNSVPMAGPFITGKRKKGYPFGCLLCSLRFAIESTFNMHLLSHANDIEAKPHPCPKCGRRFKDEKSLGMHLRLQNIYCRPERRAEVEELYASVSEFKVESKPDIKPDTTEVNPHDLLDVQLGDKEMFQCPHCIKAFDSPWTLKGHITRMHTIKPEVVRVPRSELYPHQCPLCKGSFKFEDSLETHILKHAKDLKKPIDCDNCHRRFINESKLEHHARFCDRSEEEGIKVKQMYEHIVKVIAENKANKTNEEMDVVKKEYKCSQCDSIFNYRSARRKHVTLVHPDCDPNDDLPQPEEKEVEWFMCNLCGQVFDNRKGKRSHMIKIHSTSVEKIKTISKPFAKKRKPRPPHMCRVCIKRFTYEEDLKVHMLTHETDLAERPFGCPKCERRFMVQRTLDEHLEVHNGMLNKRMMEKLKKRSPYCCPICAFGCTFEMDLENHLLTHANDAAKRPFACKKCERRFKVKRYYELHLEMHVGGSPETKSFPPKLICQVCTRIFYHASGLTEHMLIHENDAAVRPHGCSLCERRFVLKPALDLHLKTKHGLVQLEFNDSTHWNSLNNGMEWADTASECFTGDNTELEAAGEDGYTITDVETLSQSDFEDAGNDDYDSTSPRKRSRYPIKVDLLPDSLQGSIDSLSSHQESAVTTPRFVSSSKESIGHDIVELILDSVCGNEEKNKNIGEEIVDTILDTVCETDQTIDESNDAASSIPESDIGRDVIEFILDSVCRKTEEEEDDETDDMLGCPLCTKEYDNKVSLNSHCVKAHGAGADFLEDVLFYCCKICGRRCATEKFYLCHLREHRPHVGGNFFCPKCPMRFKNKSRLQTHSKFHRLNPTAEDLAEPVEMSEEGLIGDGDIGKEILECILESVFSSADKSNTQQTEETFKLVTRRCNLCYKRYANEEFYLKHECTGRRPEKEEKAPEPVSGRCPLPLCNRQFTTIGSLKSHCIKEHGAKYESCSVVSNDCKLCGRLFASEDYYYKHKCFQRNNKSVWRSSIIYGNSENNDYDSGEFPCNLCPLIFKSEYRLQSHTIAHESGGEQFEDVDELVESLAEAAVRIPSGEGDEMSEKLQCTLCDLLYDTEKSLKYHIRRAHIKKVPVEKKAMPYKCDQCPMEFAYEPSLLKHLSTHTYSQHACPKCMKPFESVYEYDLHLKTHVAEGPVVRNDFSSPGYKRKSEVFSHCCPHCSKRFLTEKSLNLHVVKHIGEVIVKQEQPEFPNMSGETENGMIVEAEFMEPTNDDSKAYDCTLCSKTYYDKEGFDQHLQLHASKPFKCGTCESLFTTQENLKKHVVNNHTNVIFSCPYCRRKFKHLQMFYSHLQLHGVEHDSSTEKLSCPCCDKIFKYEKNLSVHLLRHTGAGTLPKKTAERSNTTETVSNVTAENEVPKHSLNANSFQPVPCRYCRKRFADKAAVDAHIRVSHKKVPGEVHPCSTCGKSFNLRANLARHEKEVHGSSTRSTVPRSATMLECCGESFATKKLHKIHVLRFHRDDESRNIVKPKPTENGSFPFNCLQCGKHFMFENNLKNHLLTHNSIGPEATARTATPTLTHKAGKAVQNKSKPGKFSQLSDPAVPQDWASKVIKSEDGGFDCQYCNRHFMFEANLKNHLKTHTNVSTESTGEAIARKALELAKAKKASGKAVAKKSTTTASAKYTKNSNLGKATAGLTPQFCQFCGKRFEQSSDLKIHLRIHTGERPISCWHCSLTFAQISTRNLHAIKAHRETRRCNVCSKVLENAVVLETHMASKHSEIARASPNAEAQSSNASFHCPYCKKNFKIKKRFDAHMLLHVGDTLSTSQPYSCSICARSYDTEKILKHHMSRYHKDLKTVSRKPTKQQKRKNLDNDDLEISTEFVGTSTHFKAHSNDPVCIDISDDDDY